MKAKRMLAIIAIAFAILCGFAFASAKAQTNANFVKPDETKRLVLREGAAKKVYCDSGQVGAYSILTESYNYRQGYNRIFSPLLYVNVFHSQDRKTWRWIDFEIVENRVTSIDKDNERKFFFSRKMDGFYCLEMSHYFDSSLRRDSIHGISFSSRISVVLKTFSWKSLVEDIDSATKVENPDGFSEEKMKLQDLGADYIDQAKKISVILRIAAESISTNPARICYAKYLPAKGDEADSDLVKYKNLFYVKALAGSVASFAKSLQREPAFRAYAQDLAKATDELKKMIDKWQLEQKRQLPRSRLTMPPDKVFQEAAESMRKVAVCVETASEAMKSNLVLAEGGQVRRFSPLLARELAVPVIVQSGQNCDKTATLMAIKYHHPDVNIDTEWLEKDNSPSKELRSLIKGTQFCGGKDTWFSLFASQISEDKPVKMTIDARLLPGGNGDYSGSGWITNHAFIVRGFGSDGSFICNNWGERWVLPKEKMEEISKETLEAFLRALEVHRERFREEYFGGTAYEKAVPPTSVEAQVSSVSETKDNTLVLEKK